MAADDRPVGVDEGQRSADRCRVADDLCHKLDLAEDALHEFVLLATPDGEAGCGAEPEEASFADHAGPLVQVPFRIDDPHAPGCDRDVIDVGAGAGDAPVVQRDDADVSKQVEHGSDALFADDAFRPGLGAAARPIIDREKGRDSADEPGAEDRL
jgi:hypothetical protein